ncbi:MAG: hypothetical protein AABZ84_06990 [Pseudomonadota bacterium]
MQIIDACTGCAGPLTFTERSLLRTLLEQPDSTKWRSARHILVSPVPFITLERAYQAVSPHELNQIPDSFTLHRALRYAVAERKKYLAQPHIQPLREFEML